MRPPRGLVVPLVCVFASLVMAPTGGQAPVIHPTPTPAWAPVPAIAPAPSMPGPSGASTPQVFPPPTLNETLPTLCLAKAAERDADIFITFSWFGFRLVHTTTLVNGEPKTTTAYVPETKEKSLSMAAEGIQAVGQDGRGIEPRELLKRLAARAPVLVVPVSFDDPKPAVDPAFLKTLREDAVLFLVPNRLPLPPVPR